MGYFLCYCHYVSQFLAPRFAFILVFSNIVTFSKLELHNETQCTHMLMVMTIGYKMA